MHGAQQTLVEVAGIADSAPSRSEREEALPSLAAGQAALGMWDDALDTSGTITNDWLRFRALSAIARAQAQEGLLDAARQTFSDALGTANETGVLQGLAIAMLADTLADVGFWDEAVGVARAHPIDFDRSLLLSQIGQAQAEAGQMDMARRTLSNAMAVANELAAFPEHSEALLAVANAQAVLGAWGEAMNTVSTIADDRYRYAALAAVAVAQAESGLLDQARQTLAEAGAMNGAHSIDDDEDRSRALSAIARAQAAAGSLDTARTTFTDATAAAYVVADNEDRSRTLSAIARDQVEAELEDEARATFGEAVDAANAMTYEQRSRLIVVDIAVQQAQAGLWDDARETAYVPDRDLVAPRALLAITRAQAEAAVAALGER